MTKSIATFLFLLMSLTGGAQIPESTFSQLRNELSKKINQLRIEQEVSPLETNAILRKAAKIQSIYMAKTKTLTHNQANPKFRTPRNRVMHFKGNEFEMIGENVLQSAPIRLPLNKKSILELAEEMVTSWKNSPGHYANMINRDYKFTGIDFQFDPSRRVIYATQVFGRKGARIPGQLSPNAFGLTDNELNCKVDFASNLIANMGNSIRIEGNKVVFYYYDFADFNEIFSRPDDGIAIDLIFRNQLKCNVPNQIDYSPIYDGILLKPVYRDEILKNNEAKSKYRIITQVGTIPDSLVSSEISCSVILIQNGKKCKYLIPGYVPKKRYQLINLDPKLSNPTHINLKKTGIVASQELAYDFESNITTPVNYPTVKKSDYKIHSVDITSYSSVEGDLQNNAALHNQRAQKIKQHVLRETGQRQLKTTIDAKENWDKMYFQLRYYMANDLASLPKEAIKNILETEDNRLPWDSLLFDQRKSIATINYSSTISKEQDPKQFFAMNFKTAIAENNMDLANKALFEMYHANEVKTELLFEDAPFKAIMQRPELTQNVAAVLSKTYKKDLSRTIEFLFNWLNKGNALSPESKHNLLHLYTLLSIELLNSWDLPAKRLANVVHPSIVKQQADNLLQDELRLNLHLAFIRYYGQINDGPNITQSFNYIADYFKKRNLNIEDDIKLVLFFNRWSRYDLTNDHLLYKFQNGTLNEEAVFILLKTLYFYAPEGKDISYHEEVILKAAELNKKKWCNWVDDEFQILRDQEIKELYCSKCGYH